MATEVAGTRTYHVTVTVPDDGEDRNMTTLGAALEDLADRTAALHSQPAGDEQIHEGTERSTTVHIAPRLFVDWYNGTFLVQNNGYLNIGAAGHIAVANNGTIDLASGATLTAASDSAVNLNGTVSIGATAAVTENTGATVTEGATYTQSGRRALSGEGRIDWRAVRLVGEATIDAKDGDVFIVPSGVLSGDITIQLGTGTGVYNGARVRFVSQEGTHAVTFTSGGSVFTTNDLAGIWSTVLRNSTGRAQWIEFMYGDGVTAQGHPAQGWHVIGYHII